MTNQSLLNTIHLQSPLIPTCGNLQPSTKLLSPVSLTHPRYIFITFLRDTVQMYISRFKDPSIPHYVCTRHIKVCHFVSNPHLSPKTSKGTLHCTTTTLTYASEPTTTLPRKLHTASFGQVLELRSMPTMFKMAPTGDQI